MSKVDALRALREARYAATPARPAVTVKPTVKATVKAPVKARAAVPKTVVTEVAAGETAEPGLCGHRSMNNRSCTRPSGHAEKNHRYS